MYGFNGIQKSNYFRGEPIGRAEVEVRVGKLKNGKAAGKDVIIGKIIKGGGDRGSGLDLEAIVIWHLRVVLCLKIRDLL